MTDDLDLDHLARLAALSLPPERHERLRADLGRILAHIDRMDGVDTEGVEPTVLGGGAGQPLRPDESRPCLGADEATAMAPESDDGYFVVPVVLDHDAES